MSRLVIGTAGHVDHGKTSLVRALTGVDLDRTPEEKERGITITLGFTPLTLPGGRTAGLVDVPGHERLVRTMIAGASGMDAVMLCVSAVEGVMPQTREHLAILGLLGVKTGIVVLTMADLVDAELLELAMEDVRDQVAGTFLDGAPIIATSAVTGQGLDAVRAALDSVAAPSRDASGPFRLPVDRAFARKGFGTVVTGTVWQGRLSDGSDVEIAPGGRRVRLRGIQIHGAGVSEAVAGARTALNLSGVDLEDVGRGAWIVSPGAVPDAVVIDVRYQHLPDSDTLEDETRAIVMLGTREVSARLVPLSGPVAPGATAFLQIRAVEPLPCLPGDRFVVRRESPAATLGGGVVLDPWALVTRRARFSDAVAELARLDDGEREVLLERRGALGCSDAEARARGVEGLRFGDRVLAPKVVDALRAEISRTLSAYHTDNPLSPGANRKALHVGTLRGLDERVFLALLEGEIAAKHVELDAGRVRLPGFQVTLTPSQDAWLVATRGALEAAEWEGLAELIEHPHQESLAFLLRDRSEAYSIAGRWYGNPALSRLIAAVNAHFDVSPTLDPAAFKDITNLSRKTAIPLLEWLDSQGITKRKGDVRIRP